MPSFCLLGPSERLGFLYRGEKLQAHPNIAVFWELILTVNRQLILPTDKIHKLHSELAFWKNRVTASKHQMQRLCGVLNFCCKVVRGGRVFMYHMIQLLKRFNDRPRITLPRSFFEDLSWWDKFAESFNGYADFFDTQENSVDIYTDACLYGMAAIYANDFYQARVYPSDGDMITFGEISPHAYDVMINSSHAQNINVLELVAVYLALSRWSSKLKNCRVVLHCDNLQVCYNLSRDKTRNELSNACLREIFWICVLNNIYISPAYIPSSANVEADYLSRYIFH